MPLDFILSKRGEKKLVHDNFLFNYRETKNGVAIWRCENYKLINGNCKAKIFTNGKDEQNNIIEVRGTHTDLADPVEIAKKRTLSNAKIQAKNEPTKKTRDIIAHSLRNVEDNVRAAVDVDSTARVVRRVKRVIF